VDLMMPVWSPGYYVVEDYASRVQRITARAADGSTLQIDRPKPNRWTVRTNGQSSITLAYTLRCQQRSVTTNWVASDLGVFNGAATFITLAEQRRRPHEVRVELPPSWPKVMSGLDPAADGQPSHFLAPDYETLVDSPIVAGELSVHEVTA